MAALPITYDGHPDAPVLFFIHGWPDDESLWEDQIAYYTRKHWRCARVTLPHFARTPDVHQGMDWNTSGYSMEDIVEMLHEAVKRVTSECWFGPPVLVAHDWGSVYAFYLLKKYPDAAPALVTLDVGLVSSANIGREPTLSNYGWLLKLGCRYQYANILLFFAGRLPWFGSFLRRKLAPVNPLSAYPYWKLHRDHLTHAMFGCFGWKLPKWQTDPIKGNFPPCPTLLVFGSAKGEDFSFHDDYFKRELECRADGSDAIGVDAGHWVMTSRQMYSGPTPPEEYLQTILKPGDTDNFHSLMDGFLARLAASGTIRRPP